MLLKEQTQAENKKIEKYKNAGYTELKQAAWKKKKKEDPNGDFVNVGTYYYGYKKSATPKPKKDPAPVQDPKQDPAQTTTGGSQQTTGGGTQTTTGGGGTTVTKQDPIGPTTTTKSNADVAFCKCWTSDNKFAHDFSEDDRNKMAEEFINFAQEYGFFSGVETDVETKCGDSNCIYYQRPLVKKLALRQISVGNITDTKSLYKIWKETMEQKKAAETKQAEPEPEKPKSTIEYLNLNIRNFFTKAKENTLLYGQNAGKFQENLDDLENLAIMAKNEKNCKESLKLYYDLYKRNIEFSFGDPNTSKQTAYSSRSEYWYGFLNVLMEIKRYLKNCKGLKLDRDLMNSISNIPDTDVWNFNINIPDISKFDSEFISKAEPLVVQENTTIRKKLIEYKEMKTLKESVRNKILLTKENKDKKVNKISENLYKIAGDFYNDRYDVFFNKYVRLKESYKKSKMFLMEGASDNFQNALTRVFKGDEEQLVNEAISWFINKLGLEGSVRTQVEEKLKDKYSGDSVANLFEDDWSDIVVAAVRDNAKSDVSEPSNVMDAVEKVMMSKLDTSDFDYQLKKIISNMIRPAQDEKKEKIQTLADQLKSSILNSES